MVEIEGLNQLQIKRREKENEVACLCQKEITLKGELKNLEEAIIAELEERIKAKKLTNSGLESQKNCLEKKLKEITLNVDDYMQNIDQIMFAIYYLGIETINLFSKKELPKQVKRMIRKTSESPRLPSVITQQGTAISADRQLLTSTKGWIAGSSAPLKRRRRRASDAGR